MNTLKEILVDAARYRWWRVNANQVLDWLDTHPTASAKDCDDYIDERIARVE